MARRIVRLEAGDDLAYRSAVAPLTPAIERALDAGVRASRAWGRGQVRAVRLEPWRPARRAWRGAIREAIEEEPRPVALVADVWRCYASIRPAILEERLRQLGAAHDHVAAVRAILERIDEPGLPVGPAPSAILANAVLSALDEATRASGLLHLRWVDDVVAFARTRREAVVALDRLGRALEATGLEAHPAKTTIVTGRTALRRRLLDGHPSAEGSDPVR